MTRTTLNKAGLPEPARQALITTGENLRIARKRRGWRMEDLAATLLVTRKTLTRV